MGISTASRLGVQQLVAIATLNDMGKLPKSPAYQDIIKKLVVRLEKKIPIARGLLLQESEPCH